MLAAFAGGLHGESFEALAHDLGCLLQHLDALFGAQPAITIPKQTIRRIESLFDDIGAGGGDGGYLRAIERRPDHLFFPGLSAGHHQRKAIDHFISICVIENRVVDLH